MPSNTPNIPDRTVFIGDNLDIMRGLDSNIADLIYLDPPFNSNRDYSAPIGSKAAGAAFQDTWSLSDVDLAWHGQIADENPALYEIIRSARLAHGDGMMSYLIMMGVRLLEMKRLLKPTGSIYLHCDPTASHYLKLVMDTVFGKKNFRNEISWQRAAGRAKGSQYTPKSYGNDYDIILFYSNSDKFQFGGGYRPLTPEESVELFPFADDKGRYKTNVPIFCSPGMGARPNLCYTYNGVTNPHPSGWRVSKEKLTQMDRNGEIIWREGKRPLRKSYEKDYRGKPIGNLWIDIPNLTGHKESVGYPTQKPLALLDRIIKTSTKEGDVVLDPFAGCATACVSSERLNRKWIGIDLSTKAGEMIQLRLNKDLGLTSALATVRTDIPTRTDLEDDPRTDRQVKEALYGAQEGNCNGCQHHFPFRNLTRDHIIPRSKGGSDHPSNIQLLCAVCNSMKGTGTHAALLAKLSALPGSIRG